jgi:hypothetical protein
LPHLVLSTRKKPNSNTLLKELLLATIIRGHVWAQIRKQESADKIAVFGPFEMGACALQKNKMTEQNQREYRNLEKGTCYG